MENGLYLLLVSVHGLVRGTDLELGRDSDTGGQIQYVVELARALIEQPEVERVDLLTRRVVDSRVDEAYAREVEPVVPGFNILRVDCGPNRYLRKESLWPHLDTFVDETLQRLRRDGRAPDLIHGHYADGGYVASRLAGILNVPMAFTGHSLGRVKRSRLLEQGVAGEVMEKRYRLRRRIEAEEDALSHAALVVASTEQEVNEQYEVYDHYQPRRMMVISPGVDLGRFSPPKRLRLAHSPVFHRLEPFLADTGKPLILALSRPDPKKNLTTLVQAYGENRALREATNLVLVAGSRSDIRTMDRGSRRVLTDLLHLIDYYDLYGKVAYPKEHRSEEVPEFYRLAARSRGVFVNPALTEPFGLTLLEAAASGLPVVATQDGGPVEIVARCRNGLLVDPLDADGLGRALLEAVSDRDRWRRWSRNGIVGAQRHFSWRTHAQKYLRVVKVIVERADKRRFYLPKHRLITADRLFVTDIDNTLIGDREALGELIQRLRDAGGRVAFGVATGRSAQLALEVLKKWKVPTPQFLITSVGTCIRYGPALVEDKGWAQYIRYRWRPEQVREALDGIAGLKLQGPEGQGEFKVSYLVDREKRLSTRTIVKQLRQAGLQANVVYSHQAFLDVIPVRASKGRALRYLATKWGIPLERCLVAGDSGNDEEMLRGNTLAVVVGNYDAELEPLRGEPQIYFARGHFARGILEGIEHYDFLTQGQQPLPDGEDD